MGVIYYPSGAIVAGATTQVQVNIGGALYADAGFTYTASTTSVFIGVPSASLSSYLQPHAENIPAGLQVNRQVLLASADTTADAANFVFQSDKNIACDAVDITSDFTNCPTAAIVGLENTVYFNVPVGQHNLNVQTCYEGIISAYGAGTQDWTAGIQLGAENIGTGIVASQTGFYAFQNHNDGGGTVHNSYGYHSDTQAGIGDTLNAAFHADTQGAGANDYAFYSAGGKNFFGGTEGTKFGGLVTLVTHTPSSATDTGTAGQVAWDASYIYVCIATNSWKRAAIAAGF
jgi:hypothetical protein